jgi:hypothetical protein
VHIQHVFANSDCLTHFALQLQQIGSVLLYVNVCKVGIDLLVDVGLQQYLCIPSVLDVVVLKC